MKVREAELLEKGQLAQIKANYNEDLKHLMESRENARELMADYRAFKIRALIKSKSDEGYFRSLSL